jgi:cobalt-zinc-cadmium efflux system outer membrane protein
MRIGNRVEGGMGRAPAIACLTAGYLLRCGWTSSAETIRYDDVLRLARERAPTVLSARAELAEARARTAGARLYLTENPEVEGAAGARDSERGRTTDAEVGLFQRLDSPGSRSARIDAADADVAAANARTGDAVRLALHDAAVAFFTAIHAIRRREIASEASVMSARLAEATRKRFDAGDVPVLDLNLAETVTARARADALDAEALAASATGTLRRLLGFQPDEELEIRGELDSTTTITFSDLLHGVHGRPDLQALRADVAAATARFDLARRRAWPRVAVGARYEREEDADVLLAQVAIPIPLFDRGQGDRAEAKARLESLRLELRTRQTNAEAEVRTLHAVLERRIEAAAELARVVSKLDENQRLAERSYDAGELDLAEFLLVRRELAELRTAHLGRLLDRALAAIDLQAAAGVLR